MTKIDQASPIPTPNSMYTANISLKLSHFYGWSIIYETYKDRKIANNTYGQIDL